MPVEDKFLHSPPAPDVTRWPLDTPWITAKLRATGQEVNSTAMLDKMQSALDDMTERCRTAERRMAGLEN